MRLTILGKLSAAQRSERVAKEGRRTGGKSIRTGKQPPRPWHVLTYSGLPLTPIGSSRCGGIREIGISELAEYYVRMYIYIGTKVEASKGWRDLCDTL